MLCYKLFYSIHAKDIYFVSDLHGYVRCLLDVQGTIFNLIPITQVLKMYDSGMSRDKVIKSWKDDDEQLETILQHWVMDNNVAEDLVVLKKALESLKQEG